MIQNTNKLMIGYFACILLLLAMPVRMLGAENHLVAISSAVDASTLLATQKIELKAKAVAAIQGGVPAEDVEIVITRALHRKADAATISRYLATSGAVKKEGLPIGPVLDRIEQGLSKGVPPTQVAQASERLADKLRSARPLIDQLLREGLSGKGDREEAITATARALEQSFSEEALIGFGTAVRRSKGSLQVFTRTLDTASSLSANGVSGKTALSLVTTAVERGYTARDLDTMARRLDAEVKKGARPEDAAAAIGREDMRDARSMRRDDMRRDIKSDHGRGAGSGMGRGR